MRAFMLRSVIPWLLSIGTALTCAGPASADQDDNATRTRILQAIDGSVEAHREKLTNEDFESLGEFKKAFLRNPRPFDVIGVATRTVSNGSATPTFRGTIPVMGTANYRKNSDGTVGPIDVAISKDQALGWLESAKEDIRLRDVLVGLCVREGTNARTLADPEVMYIKKLAFDGGIAVIMDQLIAEERDLNDKPFTAEVLQTSEAFRFQKQIGAFTLRIEYEAFRAQVGFQHRVGLTDDVLNALATKHGFANLPGVSPDELKNERALMHKLLDQLERMGHPTMEAVRSYQRIEGNVDYLLDPDFYDAKALRMTIQRLREGTPTEAQQESTWKFVVPEYISQLPAIAKIGLALLGLVVLAGIARACHNNLSAIGCVAVSLIVAGLIASVATANGFYIAVGFATFVVMAILNGITRNPEEFLRR